MDAGVGSLNARFRAAWHGVHKPGVAQGDPDVIGIVAMKLRRSARLHLDVENPHAHILVNRVMMRLARGGHGLLGSREARADQRRQDESHVNVYTRFSAVNRAATRHRRRLPRPSANCRRPRPKLHVPALFQPESSPRDSPWRKRWNTLPESPEFARAR